MEDRELAEESTKSKRGRRNRQRGQEHERFVANSLRAIGLYVESSREYTIRSSRTWDVRFNLQGVWTRIQCKRRRPKGPIGAIGADLKHNNVEWYSVWTDGNPILAVVKWDYLIKLLKEAKDKHVVDSNDGIASAINGDWIRLRDTNKDAQQ